MCRLILENVPDVLRNIFKNELKKKFCHSWDDNPSSGQFIIKNDHWQVRLQKAQLIILENGKMEEWDSYLLFYLLLHSGLCLLADKFQGTQCIITVESNMIYSSVSDIDLQRMIEIGDKIIFDLGTDYFRTDIVRVYGNCFEIKHIFKPKNEIRSSVMTVDVYICRREWCSIEKLAILLSNNYACIKEENVDAAHLHRLIQCAENIYMELGVSGEVITAMKSIEEG